MLVSERACHRDQLIQSNEYHDATDPGQEISKDRITQERQQDEGRKPGSNRLGYPG